MYCTICEIEIDDVSHYKTEIHGINARRKPFRYPPLVLEELDQNSTSEDLSLDINCSANLNSLLPETSNIFGKKTKKCLFCDKMESIKHYNEHGFSSGQSYYLSATRCHVCFEKFVDREMLLKHLNQEVHRTAFTDGVSLFLRNGKILNPTKILMPVKNSGFWMEKSDIYKKFQKALFRNEPAGEDNKDVTNQ